MSRVEVTSPTLRPCSIPPQRRAMADRSNVSQHAVYRGPKTRGLALLYAAPDPKLAVMTVLEEPHAVPQHVQQNVEIVPAPQISQKQRERDAVVLVSALLSPASASNAPKKKVHFPDDDEALTSVRYFRKDQRMGVADAEGTSSSVAADGGQTPTNTAKAVAKERQIGQALKEAHRSTSQTSIGPIVPERTSSTSCLESRPQACPCPRQSSQPASDSLKQTQPAPSPQTRQQASPCPQTLPQPRGIGKPRLSDAASAPASRAPIRPVESQLSSSGALDSGSTSGSGETCASEDNDTTRALSPLLATVSTASTPTDTSDVVEQSVPDDCGTSEEGTRALFDTAFKAMPMPRMDEDEMLALPTLPFAAVAGQDDAMDIDSNVNQVEHADVDLRDSANTPPLHVRRSPPRAASHVVKDVREVRYAPIRRRSSSLAAPCRVGDNHIHGNHTPDHRSRPRDALHVADADQGRRHIDRHALSPPRAVPRLASDNHDERLAAEMRNKARVSEPTTSSHRHLLQDNGKRPRTELDPEYRLYERTDWAPNQQKYTYRWRDKVESHQAHRAAPASTPRQANGAARTGTPRADIKRSTQSTQSDQQDQERMSSEGPVYKKRKFPQRDIVELVRGEVKAPSSWD